MGRVITPAQAATLRAVLALWERSRSHHVTVRDVMDELGLSSPSTAHFHLRALRDAGLVDWGDGQAGTIHPVSRPIGWVSLLSIEAS